MEDLLLMLTLDDLIALSVFIFGCTSAVLFMTPRAAARFYSKDFIHSVKIFTDNINANLIERYPMKGTLTPRIFTYKRVKQSSRDSEKVPLPLSA
jgi:hypothetical protein